jgi:hypothetical protein
MFGAVAVYVAPASRRRFFSFGHGAKTPAGRRRHKTARGYQRKSVSVGCS